MSKYKSVVIDKNDLKQLEDYLNARGVKGIVLGNDVQIRTIEELRHHFDMALILVYFLTGRLLSWLDEKYYEVEAEKVEQLSKDDPNLQEKLCEILGVEPSTYVKSVSLRNEQIKQLKEYTDDPAILDSVDIIAFDQEELSNLLNDGVSTIYLFKYTFNIPIRKKNKTYIGIGEPIALIRRDETVDFAALNIFFENVQVENNNEILITNKSAEELYEIGRYFEYNVKTKDEERANKYYRKAIEKGNADAMCHIANRAISDLDEQKRTELHQKAFELRLKAAENGDSIAMEKLGESYLGYNGIKRDEVKAFKWFKAASDAGNFNAMQRLAGLYRSGIGTAQNFNKYLELLSRAADNGNANAKYELNEYYKNKKACFITTAVCDSFGKSDDCFELTTFRKFRDKWLITQPDGKTLIKEYYAIAPKIVSNINQLADSAQIYRTIWQKHLEPCLNFIQHGDNLACKNKYVEMILELKKKYL